MDASDHKSAGPPAFIANAAPDAGGWMRFDRYMELALYHPGEGYYASGRARIGAGGDFDTAAETSALFGRALAGQCLEALDACGGGDIAELGPGSGRLAEVLLEELKRAGRLPDRYILVEPAAGMRAAQRERLLKAHPDLAGRLQFTDRLSGERIRGVIELYLAERGGGTLGCHSAHTWHDDPFRRPGREDIGAWVDFTAVKRSAEAAGLRAVGFATQAQFLLASGILELAGSPPALEDAAALRRLILPGGMGEAFKFLGLAPGKEPSPTLTGTQRRRSSFPRSGAAPSGFGGRDLLASLEPGGAGAAAPEGATT